MLPAFQHPPDLVQHTISLTQNVVIPESQHTPTSALEPTSTPLVANGLRVLATIGFNDKLPFNTREVGNEWTNRMLAPEFAAAEAPGAKEIPEQPLRIGHMTPQVAYDGIDHVPILVEASEEMACADGGTLFRRAAARRPPPRSGGGVRIAEAAT